MVKLRARVSIPLEEGDHSEFITFDGLADDADHFAVCINTHLRPGHEPPLVRIHSECITGDLFGSMRCDCGAQLEEARGLFRTAGGILLYLRQEGRGIGLKRKLDAYLLQEQGLDTFAANEELNLPRDGREFRCAAQMLHAMGIVRIRLLTNNPRKAHALTAHGIDVVAVQRTARYQNVHNERYLLAKQEQDGHVFLPA